MPISPKVRWLFWIVFSGCYAAVTFVSLKLVKKDGSVAVDFFRSMTSVYALVFAGAVAWGLCRLAGFNLRSQAETPLEVEAGQVAPSSFELRSYAIQSAFRILAGLYVVVALLMIPIEIFLRWRIKNPPPFWPLFFGAFAIAGMFWLVSYFFRKGKFVARANAEGVEIQDLGQHHKRTHLKWAEIANSVRVDNFSVMGSNSHLEFRGAEGKAKAQVFLNLAPAAQQREFVRVVARYLSRSSES